MSEPTKRRRIGTLIASHTGAAAVSGFAASIFTAEAAQNAALLEVVKQAGIGGAMVTLCLGFAFAILQTRERHHREESAERSATFGKAFEVQGSAHEKDRASMTALADVLGKIQGTMGEMRATLEGTQRLIAILIGEDAGRGREKHGD